MSSDTAATRTTHRAAFYDHHVDPELRLLNARELRAIRDAHVPMYWFVPCYADGAVNRSRTHKGACTCGVEFLPSRNAGDVIDAADSHLGDVIEFAKGRKRAEARANIERDQVDRAIESALEDGYAQLAEADGALSRLPRRS